MTPEIVEGIKIIHDDDAIVVIDKPVGVAVHPSPGWSGPTVVGHLAGAGFRISTSGASERQGIVQRLDVGTSGVMVICKSEHAYSVLKNAFRHRTVDKVYHALVQGHPDPHEGTIDAPIGRHHKSDWKFAVMADGRHSVTHYETLDAPATPACSRSTSRPAAPTRSASTWWRQHPLCRRPDVRRRSLAGQAGRPRAAVAACQAARLRAPGHGGPRRVRVVLPRRPDSSPGSHPGCRLTWSSDQPRPPTRRPSPRSRSPRVPRPRCRRTPHRRRGTGLARRTAARGRGLGGRGRRHRRRLRPADPHLAR